MPQKFSFRNEGDIKTFLDEGIQTQHYQKTYPRRKTIKVNENEMLTEETSGFQEGRKSNGMGMSKGEQTMLLMSFVKTLKGEGKKNIT